AQQEEAARIERIMERAANLLLQVAIEIDEEIAAGDQVDARERRVLQQIMNREQHDIAQLLAHAIPVSLAREEAAQALFPDIRLDRRAVAPLARDAQRPRIEIGAKNLDR